MELENTEVVPFGPVVVAVAVMRAGRPGTPSRRSEREFADAGPSIVTVEGAEEGLALRRTSVSVRGLAKNSRRMVLLAGR